MVSAPGAVIRGPSWRDVTVFDLPGQWSVNPRVSLGTLTLLNTEIERGDQVPSPCRDRPLTIFGLNLVVVVVTMHRLLERQNSLSRGQWRCRIKILLQTFSSRYIKMILRELLVLTVGGSPGAQRNCQQGLKIVASAISFDRFFTVAEQLCEVPD